MKHGGVSTRDVVTDVEESRTDIYFKLTLVNFDTICSPIFPENRFFEARMAVAVVP